MTKDCRWLRRRPCGRGVEWIASGMKGLAIGGEAWRGIALKASKGAGDVSFFSLLSLVVLFRMVQVICFWFFRMVAAWFFFP